MQRLEVSGVVQLVYRSLGVKGLIPFVSIPQGDHVDCPLTLALKYFLVACC